MNKIILFIAALFILFTSCQDNLLTEQERDSANGTSISTRGDTENVCVASWNTQLLDTGDFFGWAGDAPQCEGAECDARAKKICEQVSELLDPSPAIVNFQEVFEADAAAALISCMESNGYLFHTGFDGNEDGSDCFWFSDSESEGSGLITFSKFPIVSTTSEDFEDCNGCAGSGNDCYAEKGMMLTEIEVSPGCTIFNFNTHLDAGDSDEDKEARLKQLAQIKDFLANNVPDGSPLMISGDFNIKKSDNHEYYQLQQALGSATNTSYLAGTKDGITSPGKDGEAGTTLDYIFGQNINSATYKVYYQTTECWWEYNEVIKTQGGPKVFGDYDLWDLDANGEIDPKTIVEFITKVTTHKYYNEADIPDHHKDKVTRVCRNVEKSSELAGETCGWHLSVSIHVLIDEFEGNEIFLLNIQNFFKNEWDIPEHLKEYYTYECTPFYDVNPSDHNPVVSCVEFDCE